MSDFKAICNALATKYGAGTIATPSGAVAMRSASGQAPHGPKQPPFVVVFPESGTIILESGAWVITHRINVDFYLSKAPGDISRVETQRQIWLPTLLAATLSGYTLGLAGTVKSALPIGYEFVELPYGGDMYDGIRINFEVIVRESITVGP